MTLQDSEVLPPIPKLRIDIVFDDETTANKFEKYFKSKKEVRSTEVKKNREFRYQLTVVMEKAFAESQIIPAIPKLIDKKTFILFCITDLQKTMTI